MDTSRDWLGTHVNLCVSCPSIGVPSVADFHCMLANMVIAVFIFVSARRYASPKISATEQPVCQFCRHYDDSCRLILAELMHFHCMELRAIVCPDMDTLSKLGLNMLPKYRMAFIPFALFLSDPLDYA